VGFENLPQVVPLPFGNTSMRVPDATTFSPGVLRSRLQA
jgi:hypothetical protein